jgi:hypothetical protein
VSNNEDPSAPPSVATVRARSNVSCKHHRHCASLAHIPALGTFSTASKPAAHQTVSSWLCQRRSAAQRRRRRAKLHPSPCNLQPVNRLASILQGGSEMTGEERPAIKAKPRVEKNRVLVTGGAGFVGSHLCDYLVARGDHVSTRFCCTAWNPSMSAGVPWPALRCACAASRLPCRTPPPLRGCTCKNGGCRPRPVCLHTHPSFLIYRCYLSTCFSH